MNTFVCKLAPILYHIILGRVKHFPIKTTHLIVTVVATCYTLFSSNTQKSLYNWHINNEQRFKMAKITKVSIYDMDGTIVFVVFWHNPLTRPNIMWYNIGAKWETKVFISHLQPCVLRIIYHKFARCFGIFHTGKHLIKPCQFFYNLCLCNFQCFAWFADNQIFASVSNAYHFKSPVVNKTNRQ